MDKVINWVYSFAVLMVIIEFLYDRYSARKLYSIKDSFQSLYLLYTFSFFFFIVKYCLQKTDTFWDLYITRVDMSQILAWVVLTIVYDFLYYWLHRLEHMPRIWKTSHIHHHSSRYMNLLTGFRSSILQPIYMIPFLLPLYLMGFRTFEIFCTVVLNKLYNCWVHQQHVKKIPILDKVLNTPSNHRVHHGRNQIYINKNFGGIFIFWDRMFGTYQAETEKVEFGVQKDPESLGIKDNFLIGFKF